MTACGCAPRYTAREVVSPPPAAPKPDTFQVEAILQEAESAYQEGVDLFVQEDFDSAGPFLEYAIALLSQDVEWSASEGALSERRILLYKCRYFLERLPVTVQEAPPPQELVDVEPRKPPLPSVEIVDNSRVQKWIRYFTGTGRATFTKWINRSGKYRGITINILQEEGLPVELVNLALIESGFNPNAYSRAHAVGMWQFIKSTGRIYSLRIDWWVDERRDPVRSCRAASRHLRDLYEALDSWPLALASYNYGQRRVERAVKRARSRDYWKLRLARETRDYVPKFLAACIIANDPERYGFEFAYEDPVQFDEIDLEPKTDLKAVASACGVAVSVIKDLNPHLVRGCAPDGKSAYPVRIPRGKLEICRSGLSRMSEEERIAQSYTSPTVRHKVKRGETLSRIARRYGTTVSIIAEANGIRNRHRIKAGQLLLIPGGEYTDFPDNPGIHVVRRGETLSKIGHTYRVKLRDLMAWNDLKSAHVIYPGQKLIVSMDHAPRDQIVTHKVRKGDTVSSIAEHYGTSTSTVLGANSLSSRDKIYPGQGIEVPVDDDWVPRGEAVVHEVRKGETITSIAKKYGTSVKAVLELNGLRSRDRIYPGQQIRVAGTSGRSSRGEVAVHEVRRGETISSIAKKYSRARSSR
jgi:membrane-bound lytic murein transglycosylase D